VNAAGGSRPTRSRLKRRLLWAGAAAVALYAAVVWVGSSLFLHVRHLKRPPTDRGTSGLAEIVAKTDDGLTLRGSYCEPADPRGVVAVFHGIGCERYRSVLPAIAAWGYVGVSFDFRCHGASEGDVTTYGWEERRDVAAVLDAIRERWPDEKIAVWGVSLGGAALCYAADSVRDLDAIVLESTYRDIDSAFEKRVLTFAPGWVVPFALPIKWLVGARLGVRPEDLRPAALVTRLRPERTLITTGDRDVWAGPDDLGALASALPGCATHVVPGGQHHDLWTAGGQGYFDVVKRFLDARLR
jgi:uncharacterized protein